MPNLNSCFAGVTGAAKHLQIGQHIGQVRVRPDRLDMVHLKPPPRAADHASPAVPLKRLHPQSLPTGAARDPRRVSLVFLQPHAMRPAAKAGARFMRCPCATATTVAATGSTRPVERPAASL